MCAYVFVVVFYVVLGFDSLPLSLLLLCTCSLSPISPLCFRVSSIRVRTALSLGIIACLHDRSLQLRPFFLLFFVVMFRLRKQPSPFLCMSETAGEKKQTFRLLNPQSPWAASSWLETITCMGAFFTGC